MWGDDEPGVPELQYEVAGLVEGESDRISRSLERDVANARVQEFEQPSLTIVQHPDLFGDPPGDQRQPSPSTAMVRCRVVRDRSTKGP